MTSLQLDGKRLRHVYRELLSAYGPQSWWPAQTRFEVMVGAVLTQNTAWSNVERAIANLREADRLSPEGILAASSETLAQWLRPSGYFNVKAKRLRAFCQALRDAGGEAALERLSTTDLRAFLLGVHGVGPETADDIVLYAFERPVFIVDAYTRRLFARLGLIAGSEAYDTLRLAVEEALGRDAAVFNELHALIVSHAKHACRPRPHCMHCTLRRQCPAAEVAG
jgi:endonuclease-3 related protein